MEHFTVRSADEARQLHEQIKQPKVKGSLGLVIDKVKLSVTTEGIDASSTREALYGAFNAAMNAIGPQYIITLSDPHELGSRRRR